MRYTARSATILICAVFCLCASSVEGATFKRLREISSGGAPQWTVFRTGEWARVVKGRLKFYSATGSVGRNLNLRGKEVFAAPPGSDVVGVLLYADRQPMTLQVVRFYLFDSKGRQQFRLDKPNFSKAIVSPTGNAVCGIKGAEGLPESILRFYDRRGRLGKSLKVERFTRGRFSRDGSQFLFETDEAGLQVASAAGVLKNTIGPALAWDTSSDGDVIVTTNGAHLQFYRDGVVEGTLAWPASQGRIRTVSVSPDGRHAAVLSATHASAVRIDPPLYLWEMESESPDWHFRSIGVADGGRITAIGSDFDSGPGTKTRHNRSRCQIVGVGGDILHTVERQPKDWGPAYPKIWLAPGGRRLVYMDRDAATLLAVEDL